MANLTEAQIRSVFDLFDADGSGWVEAEEMGLALQALGFGELSRAAVDSIVSDVLLEGNTHVEYADFKKIVQSRMAPRHSPEEVLKAFRLFDKTESGRITIDDFVKAARDTGLLAGGESDANMRKLFTQILAEANKAYPSEDLRNDATAINSQQWKAMMRMAVVDKRHKVDDSAFSLKSRAKVTKKGPYGVKVEAGRTYYWCACGMSKTQPFCDGSHAAYNKEFSCEFQPIKYVAEETRTVWFCGCKQTSSPPMCDGTHTSL
jgi:Ca2+-binding EF-hand superfamily protein/CDGSH-type Zn-finger protein